MNSSNYCNSPYIILRTNTNICLHHYLLKIKLSFFICPQHECWELHWTFVEKRSWENVCTIATLWKIAYTWSTFGEKIDEKCVEYVIICNMFTSTCRSAEKGELKWELQSIINYICFWLTPTSLVIVVLFDSNIEVK